jgi:cell division protein FtsA
VITGGSSAMQGMVELGEEIFHLPVRLGIPKYVGGLSDVVKTPRMATGVGLLLYGLEYHKNNEETRKQSNSFADVLARMKSWF